MLKISQAELSSLYNNNTPMIWQYNTLYQIQHSQAQGLFYLSQVTRRISQSGIGVTRQGRYMAMTVSEASRY